MQGSNKTKQQNMDRLRSREIVNGAEQLRYKGMENMLLDGTSGEKLLCEETENGSLRLCRVFGSVDTLVLPDTLEGGRQIKTIGAYCFAEKGRLSQALIDEAEGAGLGDGTSAPEGVLRPLNGNYLREITLPDTVTCMEAYAFYNCKKLERLTVGAVLTEINSDAFMNCRMLHTLAIRAAAGDVTGLPFLLNQLTAELCVEFVKEDTKVRLLYPEYTESYEEIGPAHIFSLHVEGEGYRARRQFVDGRLDMPGYDAVFDKACNEEQFLTLMKMALYRLEYPYELTEEAKIRYEKYISDHEVAVLEQLVHMEDEETLHMLCSQPMISDEAIQAAIVRAVSDGWTRGVAGIIRWRNEYAR